MYTKRLVWLVFVVSCASAPPPNIIEIDERGVEQCTFIADVVASSKYGIAFGEKSVTTAKTKAMSKAASLGATHVVWSAITPPTMQAGASAHGKAYRCSR
jgi:hypothetical protein